MRGRPSGRPMGDLGTEVTGGRVLHPVVLTALAIWLLNDHVLKARWPGAVTGKLSDVAGLVAFPVLLAAGIEVAKTSAADVAAAIVRGIEAGTEDIFPDAMSEQVYNAWRNDHKAIEKQFAGM